MADINASDVKLKQSQRLDDTDFGGGAMIATEVIDGMINNLFPDISRLDRVYGRVSMRKAFLNIETENRATYYGSNVVITEQAADPRVSVCFFTTKNWFDTRASAKSRVEAYLVKGPSYPAMFWADHYLGSRKLNLVTELDQLPPDIGDVILVTTNKDLAGVSILPLEQYVRVTEVSTQKRWFTDTNGARFEKRAMYVDIGSKLTFDIPGGDPVRVSNYAKLASKVIETVVADASTYYGVAQLLEDINAGELKLRVDSIFAPIVPSAASETGVVDSPVGYSRDIAMGNITGGGATITRSLTMTYASNAQLYMGEAVKPGTWTCTGTYSMTDFQGEGDPTTGNIYEGGNIVGSIDYNSGTISFGASVTANFTGSHSFTYDPHTPSARVMETSGIVISEATRGRAYTFRCVPAPQPGTIRIDYISSGKWYTLYDNGSGRCAGSDPSLGMASINYETGAVNIGLGEAMPDVDSMLIIYWGTADDYYSIVDTNCPWFWDFTLNDTSITRESLLIEWEISSINFSVADRDGLGHLDFLREGVLELANVGTINYETGEVRVENVPVTPEVGTWFDISYNKGDLIIETFFNKAFDSPNRYILPLTNSNPILPNSLRVSTTLHNKNHLTNDNLYRYAFNASLKGSYPDDGTSGLDENGPDTTDDWAAGVVDYGINGSVAYSPNRTIIRNKTEWAWGEGGIRPSAGAGVGAIPGNLSGCIGPCGGSRYSARPANVASTFEFRPPVINSTVFVSYQEVDGIDSVNYLTQIPQKYNLDPTNQGYELIAGSIRGAIFNGGSSKSPSIVDDGGKIYWLSGGSAVTRVEMGTIDYAENVFTLESMGFSSTSENLAFYIQQAQGATQMYPITEAMFRTPGAPVRVESLTLYMEDTEGNVLTASSTNQGEIIGDYVQGGINYETGVCHVAFGRWVPDDTGSQGSEWYSPEQVDGGEVWQPWPVQSNSILMNCVVTSYLPLDPELLGLNPVRLPLDGRIPIFRDAGIILIHDTKSISMPTSLVNSQVIPVGRTNVEVIRVIDYTGAVIPEIDNGTPIYSVDCELGELTVLNAGLLNNPTYPPLNIINRIEDMVLASDVQVTGHIAVVNAISHDYVAGEALVSSVMPSADLQSRIENEFEQDSWTGVWSDTPIGGQPIASFDVVNFPITVQNIDAVEERFACIIKGGDNVQIIGENLGVIFEGSYKGNIEINNPQSPGNYFFIDARGWGLGWSTGDVFRFNSKGANYPIWFVRTTLQGDPTEATDNYVTEIRGDSS